MLNETIKKTCGSKSLETANRQVNTPWQAIVVIVESVRIFKTFNCWSQLTRVQLITIKDTYRIMTLVWKVSRFFFKRFTNLAHFARAVTLRVDSQLSFESSKRCNWARSGAVDAANHHSVCSQSVHYYHWAARKSQLSKLRGLRIAKKTSDALWFFAHDGLNRLEN